MKSMKIGLQMLATGKRYDEIESYLSAMTEDNMYNEEAVSEGISIAGRHKSGTAFHMSIFDINRFNNANHAYKVSTKILTNLTIFNY